MDDSDHPRYMFKDPQEERASRDRSCDPVDLADQCLAELTGEVPPSRDVAKLRANKMNRAASDPSMRDNSRGFKTHVPGIFDKIQARLDSSVKLVDDEVEEGSNCKSNTPALPRDEVPPLRETIKPKPPASNRRRVSAPAMQGNPRGFKTHVPGIFDKIQARLDSSVKLVDDELEDDAGRKPSKTTSPAEKEPTVTKCEKRPDKPSPLSRSSSVLSSDDPLEIADQCLAEFEGTGPTIARIDLDNPERVKASECLQGYVTERLNTLGQRQQEDPAAVKQPHDVSTPKSDVITPKSNVITPPRDVITPPRDEVPPLRETIKPKPPVSNRRRVSAPAMQGNPRGFKTHVPGIFDKIQARLDSSVKLVDEETEEVSYCKPSKITTARFAEPRHAEKPEVVRGSKPASLSRSSSVLSSDDPIEIADQCLAEFQGAIPNIPSPEAITPARDVLAASSVSPSRDVAKLRATTMNRAASAPSMRGNSRGFKTHVPGIFDKIQARLDPSVKLVDDEIDNDKTDTQSSDIVTPPNDVVTPPSDVVTPPSKVITPPSRDDIDKRLNELEPDGFQYHVPDVFNKIQQKLYLNPEVKEGSEEIDSTNNTKSAELLKI